MTTIKRNIILGATVLVLLLASFAGGRYSAPAKIETHEIVKTVEIQHETTTVVQKVDLTELKSVLAQYAQQINKDVIKKIVTVVNKDGSKVVTEEIVDKSKTDTEKMSTNSTSTVVKNETATKVTNDSTKTADHETTTIVTHATAPGFSLGLQVGANFPHLLDSADLPNYIPRLPGKSVIGLFVERRLLGTVYGGVWANSRGDGGVQLRLGF